MINVKLCVLSLMITLASCQTSNSGKTAEPSGRSRQVQGEGRFFPPFVGGFGGLGGFRPGGIFGGGLFPGAYPRPGLFGGYYPGGGYRPGGYRPGGYYPGGYPGGYGGGGGGGYGGYPQYPRPGFGNRPYNGFGGGAAASPSNNRPGSDNSNINNRPNATPSLGNLSPMQAALLGQALGATLRPLLAANGGAGLGAGQGDSGSASSLADILAQLG
ncbi:uncharacterized protein LOC129949095 [Eupeodes corollae]|uniref:uncharacterized protein LOC129949095 n=1 Tax=Eupeodes corollae TaxID=290404 RepID=UPI002490C6D4|nr:uncharacterized protein LOC129949095 [Eupeodes corollae]